MGFTRLIGGDEKYGAEAKRILMECAKWDPKGSTGYRYNDEAGMPYNYYFSRTYTFINDLLSEEEKEICRGVMKVRGDEMYVPASFVAAILESLESGVAFFGGGWDCVFGRG